MNWVARWLKPTNGGGDVPPVYLKSFDLPEPVKKATLYLTAMGVYEAELNGQRVGDFILAPGWTAYHKRLQYQEYDVTALLKRHNDLQIIVGRGWYHTHLLNWDVSEKHRTLTERPFGLLAQLALTYESGKEEIVASDETWGVSQGPVRFSDIYNGEIYDANIIPCFCEYAEPFEGPSDTLIPQEGEEVRKQERVAAANIFVTPKGETVVDFGQEVTGYVMTAVNAKKGDIVDLSFAEVMDKDGNFYTENYRTAECRYHYICRDGRQTYEPKLTFWGFRYIRVNQFPGGCNTVTPGNFTAVVLHSNIKRTGRLSCSDPLLNRLFDNVIWGQKGNFLDVPTDCPQRDERLGWTGDAQVFIRTACLNYDVEKFFQKWLNDMAVEQRKDGHISSVVPDERQRPYASAAWGDAAVICPWQLYLAYGNPRVLENQFTCMCNWISYITAVTNDQYLWTGGNHFGDWLGLDAPSGSYKGSSRDDLIASAFYAYSTSLIVKSGKVLGQDVTYYEALYDHIVQAFKKTFPVYYTQTECVLAAHFLLAEDCRAVADQLAAMIIKSGVRLQTGFVGTPYLLHVLSDYGYADLSYSLLLKKDYPSWLYSVTKGATTIWEHWDGIMENGDFWSADMNSFNHYAYGSVADWVYTVAAGIRTTEEYPGYAKVKIAPVPDKRLDWLKAELDTRCGHISSRWKKFNDFWRYEITVPVEAEIVIDGISRTVNAGSYCFYSPQ
ncbi:MAG: glycoside hydrolase family 78 protein [Oscillospiraceae bacterium]|jgi:alpha-L-rhamnosidase|nr:glycoside hydrolase family 78 protein [Oscillospiraceae bacterium]